MIVPQQVLAAKLTKVTFFSVLRIIFVESRLRLIAQSGQDGKPEWIRT